MFVNERDLLDGARAWQILTFKHAGQTDFRRIGVLRMRHIRLRNSWLQVDGHRLFSIFAHVTLNMTWDEFWWVFSVFGFLN